ncbi:hypothetical protein CVT26_015611 [Gymnopilus dilepis]|uniref:DUF5648 domain-containing protein n=1 Tax=Gymnopilus dilepis TaxID=231916 RepID=A0A409YDB9_9AGAR|nr:hypothetical protein CVT26_015611 [Gymnopilus dilepis]
MKLQTSFLALLGIVVSKSFSGAMPTDNEGELQVLERRDAAAPQACGDVTKLVPFFRLWNGAVKNDYYTTSIQEKQAALAAGYSDEGVAGWIWPNTTQPELQTIPFYHVVNDQVHNDFYTIATSERDNALNNLGYRNLGIAGYVYPDGACGGLPLFRLWSNAAQNDFYTMSAGERNNVIASDSDRYILENTAAFLFRF